MTIILDGTTGITTPAINSSGDLELPGGTANGVLYLNGSKIATSGSTITYNGTTFGVDSAVVFNDSGADVDFRVESDTSASAFFLDGATGNVGLKTDTPATILSLENSLLLESTATDFPSATYDGAAFVAKTGSGGSAPFDQAGSLVYRTRVSSTAGRSSHIFYTGSPSVERLRINESGNVGIGTSSPSYILDIQAASSPTISVTDTTNSCQLLMYAQNTSAVMGVYANYPLLFATNSTERARISSDGRLLVNTTSTLDSKLIVLGGGTSSAAYACVFADSAGATLLYARNDGLISTGTRTLSPYNNTTASAANMYVDSAGDLYRSTSSLKYKTDVQDATHGLSEVMQLRSVTYKGKTDGDTVFGGLIAEEVHAAGLTEFVQYAADGSPDALAYGNMVSLLVKAIQELKAELDAAKEKIAALEAK